MYMNVCIFSGRIGNDPTLSFIPQQGKEDLAKLSFRLIVNRIGSEESDGINCTLWGKRAESLADHLRKGKMVAVLAEYRTNRRKKEGGGDGDWVYFQDFRVNQVYLGPDSTKGQTNPENTDTKTQGRAYRLEKNEDGTTRRVLISGNEKASGSKTTETKPETSPADLLAMMATMQAQLAALGGGKAVETPPAEAPVDEAPVDENDNPFEAAAGDEPPL